MSDKDWKLKLRYGQLTTPYSHYTLLADGYAEIANPDYNLEVGHCIMGLNVWATDQTEAYDVIQSVGNQLGFRITGKVELYETDAKRPPGENPSAYGANFTPYQIDT
ncbi:MAG: hypothetical protein AAFS13_10995 [Pseudomonadota bacterium]